MTPQLDEDRLSAAGLDPTAAGDLVARAQRATDDAGLPGAQLAVARHGEVVLEVAFGDATTDDAFVIFSCTKAVVAAATWLLLGDGRLELDRPVAEVLDGFGANGKEAVTPHHLLTHTGGFPHAPMGPDDWDDRDRRRARMSSWRTSWEPGTHFEYHPTAGHWVLGALIEELTGQDLRVALREMLLDPLGLDGLRVGATPTHPVTARPVQIVGERPTIDEMEAATGLRLDLDELIGEVTDDAKVLLGEQAVLDVGIPGGGAASTAGALAMLYQAFLHDPAEMWDPRWLAEGTATVHCTLPEPILGHPSLRTLGLILAGDDGKAGMRGFASTGSPRSFGHNGAGGQVAWSDPDSGLSFVYLTDGHDRDLLREWRRSAALSNRAAKLVAPAGDGEATGTGSASK